VGVSVNVKVGREVSDGGMVDISVGERVRVAVAGSIGGGGRLVTRGISTTLVAEGCVINVEVPHPVRKRAAPDKQMKNFRKLLITDD